MTTCPVCHYTLPAARSVVGEHGHPSPITDLDSHVAAAHPDHPIEHLCVCGHDDHEHERCDFPRRDDCTVCTCAHFDEVAA